MLRFILLAALATLAAALPQHPQQQQQPPQPSQAQPHPHQQQPPLQHHQPHSSLGSGPVFVARAELDSSAEVTAELKALADAEQEGGNGNGSGEEEFLLKDEPCNFNLFYACAAHQLWAFHKTFRSYMDEGQKDGAALQDPAKTKQLQVINE